MLSALALVFHCIAALCFVPVLTFAFSRSLGTGVMVLFLPIYTLYFAFGQFQHRLKGALLAGALGAFVLGVVCSALAATLNGLRLF